MIPVKEEEEKAVLSEEDGEMEKEERGVEKVAEEEEEDDDEAEESVEDGSGSEEDDGDEEPEAVLDENADKTGEDTPHPLDKTKDTPLPEEPKEKKPSDSLNVNNEVVKMRKEVKRVRTLIIRKLTRQIGNLKKKKGKQADIERNQRRAGRLLEEIHAMKVLSPDKVTKTALQKNLNFEQECKNPNSTVSDRAIARIATHPQFNKRIKDIKAAVAVFKEDRKRGGKEKEPNKAGKMIGQSDKKKENKSVNQKDIKVVGQKPMDIEEGDSLLKSTLDVVLTEADKETRTAIQTTEKTVVNDKRGMSPTNKVRAATSKNNDTKDVVKNAPIMKEKPKHTAESEEESDLDPSDDEEKEYFDDSTEERFHKQSSHSEESEEDDDFFVGKVSKFKKKKQKGTEMEKTNGTKNDQMEEDQSKREKVTSLDSIFCSSLARSKPGRGRGAGRGRNGDRGRGRGESRGADGPKGAFSKISKFQGKPFHAERGKERGRGGVTRKNDHRDGAVFSAEPALHPSWEASKKRKEQQGQILAFQGKKIKFDDD